MSRRVNKLVAMGWWWCWSCLWWWYRIKLLSQGLFNLMHGLGMSQCVWPVWSDKSLYKTRMNGLGWVTSRTQEVWEWIESPFVARKNFFEVASCDVSPPDVSLHAWYFLDLLTKLISSLSFLREVRSAKMNRTTTTTTTTTTTITTSMPFRKFFHVWVSVFRLLVFYIYHINALWLVTGDWLG